MDADVNVDLYVVIDADVVAVVCLYAPETQVHRRSHHVWLPAPRCLPRLYRIPWTDSQTGKREFQRDTAISLTNSAVLHCAHPSTRPPRAGRLDAHRADQTVASY